MDHPAFLQWRRSGYEGAPPSRIEKIDTLRGSSNVYLLRDVDVAGGRVVAKRARGRGIRVEHYVYSSLLPRLALPHARCVGFVQEPGDDSCWLFLQYVEGSLFDADDAGHRVLATRWLATLHSCTSDLADRSSLPDVGPGRYLFFLRKARESVRSNLGNSALASDAARSLERLLDRLDRLEGAWTNVEMVCGGLPSCVVHGDFHAKNVRVLDRPSGDTQLVVLDWETAGWGPPTEDLAELAPSEYASALDRTWHAMDMATIRTATTVGILFRALAFIQAESAALASSWTVDAVEAIAAHEEDLLRAERELQLV